MHDRSNILMHASSDQLALQDDPNFLPELDLLPMDLDIATAIVDLDLRRSSDLFTPQGSQEKESPLQYSGGALMAPLSVSSSLGGPIGGTGYVRCDQGSGTPVEGGFLHRDEPQGLLEDDLGIQIDADGNFFLDEELSTVAARQPHESVTGVADHAELPSEAASARVRREHGEGQKPTTFAEHEDDGFVPALDDGYIDAQADAFSARQEKEDETEHLIASESAEAEQRRRYRGPKTIPLDTSIELHNHEISAWNQEYRANMNEALRHKHAHRLVTLARKNAEHWMLGPSEEELMQGNRGPLTMFTGIKLLEAMSGLKLSPGSGKRARDDEPGTDDNRRVRSRAEPSSDEAGRGFALADDGFMPMADDYTIEQGRDQATPLDDRNMTSIFPWNQSTGSHRPTGIFSAGRRSAVGGFPLPSHSRRGSRLATASPLIGRGFPVGHEDDDLQIVGSDMDVDAKAGDEFELFGPAANVDTQTAAESQWVRAALDGESANFLEFVKAGIEELDLQRETVPLGDEEDEILHGSIEFEQLLPPSENSRVVAAQGLLHVLALVTKNAVSAEQKELFGPIGLRVLEIEA